MGVPVRQRASGAARLIGAISCAFMYWPLIGGFIAFVLIAVLLGWIMDPSRRSNTGRDGH